MKKKQLWSILIAAVIFVAVGVTSVFTHRIANNVFSESFSNILSDDSSYTFPDEDYIAVVEVNGTIQAQSQESLFESSAAYRHADTMDYIDVLMEDDRNTGILLYVDSPGGAVYESEELYNKIRMYSDKTKRPVWTYMAHYAASGGYMTSVASDYICANQNTVTGSIGVIMSGYDMSGLYEKLGIRHISITSGANKDSSRMTPEQIEIYQSQVDECYESFVEKVASGRKMEVDQVKQLADGRTYTASQALANGLIDEISSYEDMREKMKSSLKTDTIFESQLANTDTWFSSFFSNVRSLVPKSESQILLETADQLESGVLMYYAE